MQLYFFKNFLKRGPLLKSLVRVVSTLEGPDKKNHDCRSTSYLSCSRSVTVILTAVEESTSDTRFLDTVASKSICFDQCKGVESYPYVLLATVCEKVYLLHSIELYSIGLIIIVT